MTTMEAIIALAAASLGVFAVFGGIFVWGLLRGQFKNIEEAKYTMLETVYKDKKEEGDDKNA
jgi:nitrogen fixation-related uncharacterized protein